MLRNRTLYLLLYHLIVSETPLRYCCLNRHIFRLRCESRKPVGLSVETPNDGSLTRFRSTTNSSLPPLKPHLLHILVIHSFVRLLE